MDNQNFQKALAAFVKGSKKQLGFGGTIGDIANDAFLHGLDTTTFGTLGMAHSGTTSQALGLDYKTKAGKNFQDNMGQFEAGLSAVAPEVGGAILDYYVPGAGTAAKAATRKMQNYAHEEGRSDVRQEQRDTYNKIMPVASAIGSAASASMGMMNKGQGDGQGVPMGNTGMSPQDAGANYEMPSQYPVQPTNNGSLYGNPDYANLYGYAAYGGKVPMANGGLMMFNGGGTHEQNSLGGIPLGQNASVEQGETAMDLGPMSKYIFSDRLKDGKRTFAQESKSIETKFKDRKGDAAADRAKDQMLRGLAERQEKLKAAKMAKLQEQMSELSGTPEQMKNGGRIQYGNGGRAAKGYTLPTGLTADQIGAFQTYAGAQGANLGSYGVDNIYGANTQAAWNQYGQQFLNQQKGALPNTGIVVNTTPVDPNQAVVPAGPYPGLQYVDPNQMLGQDYVDAMEADYQARRAQAAASSVDPSMNTSGMTPEEQDAATSVRNRNLMIGAGALANSAGDIYGLVQGLRGPDEITLDRLNPDLINLAREREIARRQAATSQAIQRENVRAVAPSSGAALVGMTAGTAAINQNLGDLLSRSAQAEETTNTQILNAAQQANQGIDTQEQLLNLQAQAKAQEAIQAGLSGIGANTAQGLKDVRQSDAVDVRNQQQLNAMNAILQNFVINKKGEIMFKDGTLATDEDIADAIAGKEPKKKKK